MPFIVKVMLIIAGIIHLLPLSGAIGATHLERLYGLSVTEPNLLIMMRHRAILFGLLGLFMIYAAYRVDLIAVAITSGLLSAAAFIWLAWSTGEYNAAIARIVVADIIAIACLATAAACHMLSRP